MKLTERQRAVVYKLQGHPPGLILFGHDRVAARALVKHGLVMLGPFGFMLTDAGRDWYRKDFAK